VRSKQAHRIGGYLQQNLSLNDDTAAVVSYGAEVALLAVFGLASILLVSVVLHSVSETLLIAFLLYFLRATAGGAHCSNPVSCNIASAAVIPALGKLSAAWGLKLASIPFVSAVGALALILVVRLAPVDHPNKPIRTARHRQRLKIMAAFLVACLVAIQLATLTLADDKHLSLVAAISFALAWEGVILTEAGWRVMAMFDWLVDTLGRRMRK